jgi:undecaprenyl-diphosphatase
LVTLVVGAAVFVVASWLASRGAPGSVEVALFRRLNDPGPVLNVLLAVTAPLLRPIPLTLGVVVVVVVVLIVRRAQALPMLLTAAAAGALAYLVDHLAKALVDRGRPPAHLAGVLTHGYPVDPRGSGYPSSHTAVAVAVVVGAWPWLSTPWRIVAAAVALTIGLDRIYVGAHLPLDVVGGAAIGLMCGSAAVAIQQRLRRPSESPTASR